MKNDWKRAGRGGFSMLECTMAVLVSSLVVIMVHSLTSSALKLSNKTVSSEDASRALLLGMETISADLRRARVDHQSPDVVVGAGGTSLTFTILTSRITAWQATKARVTYTLEPTSKNAITARLVRVVDGKRRVLRGCGEFSNVHFAWTKPGPTTPWRSLVTVTLEAPLTFRDKGEKRAGTTGRDSVEVNDVRTLVGQIPAMYDRPPPAYPWKPAPPAT